MSDRAGTLDITAETVSVSDGIFAVRHIASIAGGRTRPYRWPGVALMLVAILVLAYESILGGGLSTIQTGGSTMIWLALITSAFGIFGQVFQRRQIVVSMADGGKLRLNAARDDFARQVVVRFGEAMRAPPGARLHYRIDTKAETIEILSAAEPAPAAAAPAAGLPPAGPLVPPAWGMAQPPQGAAQSHPTGQGHPSGVPPGANGARPAAPGPLATLPGHAMAGGGRPDVPWNGPQPVGVPVHDFAQPGSAGTGSLNGRIASLPRDGAAWPPHANGHGANGYAMTPPGGSGAHLANGGPGYGAPGPQPYRNGAVTGPPTASPGPRREVDAVIAFVTRSEIQHKQALLDLLVVVEDHVKGGGTSRDDALSNWQSFAGYVEQYLGNVEGLLGLTHRAGRALSQGPH